MPTSVTGNVKDLLGVANTGGVTVKLLLRWAGSGTPRVNGTALVLSTVASGIDRVVSNMAINSSTGAITGTVYSTRDAAGTGNGEIEVNGSLIACYYEVQIQKSGSPMFKFPVHAKNGATLDLTSATPISTDPVVVAPTGDSTYVRIDQGNISAFNAVIFSATPIFSAVGAVLHIAFKITLTGNVTSSTFTNAKAGQLITFIIVEDSSGGRTFAWPSNVKNPQSIDTSVNAINVQTFVFDGTNAYPIGNMTVN